MQITKNGGKILDGVGQIDSNAFGPSVLQLEPNNVDSLGYVTKVMVDSSIFSINGHDQAGGGGGVRRSAASCCLAPYITKITILASSPLGGPGVFDRQAGFQWIAMRDFDGAIYGRLARVSNGRSSRLSRKQQRVSVGLVPEDDGVYDKGGKNECDDGGVDVPGSKDFCNFSVQLLNRVGHGCH